VGEWSTSFRREFLVSSQMAGKRNNKVGCTHEERRGGEDA
jgi:hypothetical protein